MTTWPQAVIPNFQAGYGGLVVADLTNLVTNPLGFVTQMPVFRASQITAGQAITALTMTPIQFNSILEDPYAGWSATATGSQAAWSWLCPYTGLYEITVTACIATNAVADILEAVPTVTGTQYEASVCQAPLTVPGGASGSVIVPLIGGFDYVQGDIWCALASTTSVAVGLTSSLEIAYVSG